MVGQKWDRRGIHKEVDALIAIAESHRQDPKSGILVGLAGPQIGIAKRIIVIDDANKCIPLSAEWQKGEWLLRNTPTILRGFQSH